MDLTDFMLLKLIVLAAAAFIYGLFGGFNRRK
jgi:hypothetical protein